MLGISLFSAVCDRAQKKVWMNETVFEDWFLKQFVLTVKHAIIKVICLLSIMCGITLLLFLKRILICGEVKVIYLPLNLTHLLIAMDSGML